jgi:formyl-CoA transferase
VNQPPPHPQLTDGPLQGLRVVEFGQLLAGPFAGTLLGDFGADVIKIEPPPGGDAMRDWGRLRHRDHSLC